MMMTKLIQEAVMDVIMEALELMIPALDAATAALIPIRKTITPTTAASTRNI